jgi:hypothetical protein
MATGVPIYPAGIDSDSTLGPTSGIVPGVTHLGDIGINQGDQLGITRNLINAAILLQTNTAEGQAGTFTTAIYVQSVPGTPLQITVIDTSWMFQGGYLFIKGFTITGGYYVIQSVDSPTLVTIVNLGVVGINSPAGTSIPSLCAVQAYGFRTEPSTDSVNFYEREWDFEACLPISAGQPVTDWQLTATGTATAAPDITIADSTSIKAIGLLSLATGATAVSVGNLMARGVTIPSLTPLEITFSVSLPVLSVTATQEFIFGCGVSSAAAASNAIPFMGIGYKLNGGNVFWNAFAGTTVGANLTATTTTIAINTLYHLRMTLNAGWTAMGVSVNHSTPIVITTNLQTGTMFPCIVFSSSFGTTSKVILLDRVKLRVWISR